MSLQQLNPMLDTIYNTIPPTRAKQNEMFFCFSQQSRQQRRWEEKIIQTSDFQDDALSAEDYEKYFYSQEARDLAFCQYITKAGPKACHANMPDLIRADPVLANHLLRAAVQILVKRYSTPLTADQLEQQKRAVVSTLIYTERKSRRENIKRRNAELKAIENQIKAEKKELVRKEVEEQEGCWAKWKTRWYWIWHEIPSPLEKQIFGERGPVYRAKGWRMRQGRLSGEVVGAREEEYRSEDSNELGPRDCDRDDFE